MSFMQRQVIKDSFYRANDHHGETQMIPSDVFTEEQFRTEYDIPEDTEIETVTGFFCRLSAPGYMDCTDWSGPYATDAAANEALTEMYGEEEEESSTAE